MQKLLPPAQFYIIFGIITAVCGIVAARVSALDHVPSQLKRLVAVLLVISTLSVLPVWWILGEAMAEQSDPGIVLIIFAHGFAILLLYFLFVLWYSDLHHGKVQINNTERLKLP